MCSKGSSERGLFGGLFDFNNDGRLDSFERAAEFMAFEEIMNESKKDELISDEFDMDDE